MRENFLESGIVLVNKSVGVSSNKVVNIVKHAIGAKKCGHLGTLDLEAEGLLPVTINSATKLFDMFLKKDKTYVAVFEFGFETDTLDASGQVTCTKPCEISLKDIQNAAEKLVGKSMQMPPLYSAKKVNGKVAYKEARRGNALQLKPKEIEIFEIKVLQEICKNTFNVSVSCSSGTYIRCIARDLAKLMGTVGIMQSLVRTRCGGFYLKDAYNMKEIERGQFKIIPCQNLFDFESVYVDAKTQDKLLNGQMVDCPKQDGTYKLFGDKFLGLARLSSGKLKLDLRLI